MVSEIPSKADAVICGAGIAGVAAAYYLHLYGLDDIVIIDSEPSLSQTSSRSAECYRNWFGNPYMNQFMDDSISLMEQLAARSGNKFNMNRRGYLFVSFDPDGPSNQIQAWIQQKAAGYEGSLRSHVRVINRYRREEPALEARGNRLGADLLVDATITEAFPYLTKTATSALHIRRCGWLSAQQLGTYLFEQSSARKATARVTNVVFDRKNYRFKKLEYTRGTEVGDIEAPVFINAGGPGARAVADLMGELLEVKCTMHEKIVVNDYAGVLPREAPMIICASDLPVEVEDEDGHPARVQDE